VELQQYLSQLGLVNAINLDGGGSSTMVLQQSVMNTPSDGAERSVGAVVEVTEQRETCWHELIRC
jgi:exopolysaccharide biosynthesis protein